MDVNEELPKEKIEMDLEVRHAVTGKNGAKAWQVSIKLKILKLLIGNF
jgi:hypothetical protein